MKHVRKAGAKGGRSTLKRHGRLYYSRLAKKRWKKYRQLTTKQ